MDYWQKKERDELVKLIAQEVASELRPFLVDFKEKQRLRDLQIIDVVDHLLNQIARIDFVQNPPNG